MKWLLLILSISLASPALADDFQSIQLSRYDNAPIHHHGKQGHHRLAKQVNNEVYPYHNKNTSQDRVGFHDGRPRAWCGWYMRQMLGVSNPEYNLAANWRYYGRASEPGIGTVVVWPHHVGIITSRDNRGWIVRSGNYSNRVADVPLSRFARPIAFRS